MGLTKTEINLRRLLAAMPNQTNQAKLSQVQYKHIFIIMTIDLFLALETWFRRMIEPDQ